MVDSFLRVDPKTRKDGSLRSYEAAAVHMAHAKYGNGHFGVMRGVDTVEFAAQSLIGPSLAHKVMQGLRGIDDIRAYDKTLFVKCDCRFLSQVLCGQSILTVVRSRCMGDFGKGDAKVFLWDSGREEDLLSLDSLWDGIDGLGLVPVADVLNCESLYVKGGPDDL